MSLANSSVNRVGAKQASSWTPSSEFGTIQFGSHELGLCMAQGNRPDVPQEKHCEHIVIQYSISEPSK